MTFSVGFTPLVIFIASFYNKKAVWKLKKFDYICGVFSIVGLVLWYVTKIGNIAILFSIVSDAFASIPTLRKSFTHPESENYIAYLFAFFNATIALLTVRVWSFAIYAFPLYIVFIDALLVSLIKFRLGKRKLF